jgi:hypothetical protein
MGVLSRIWASVVMALIGSALLQFPGHGQQAEPERTCDASLWNHVYAGDPHKFSSARDRLQVIEECVTVTGTVEHARPERDGDWHIELKLDHKFADMINDRNIAAQHGDLVLESVCENRVTQQDTLEEGVCNEFHQHIFQPDMVGEHVQVTGAYVTDMAHGWREIHPVTRIVPIE